MPTSVAFTGSGRGGNATPLDMVPPTVEGHLHSLLNTSPRVCVGRPSGGVMIATVRSATILGARGHPVSVEVHVAKGIPGFTMLGLPDESCTRGA